MRKYCDALPRVGFTDEQATRIVAGFVPILEAQWDAAFLISVGDAPAALLQGAQRTSSRYASAGPHGASATVV